MTITFDPYGVQAWRGVTIKALPFDEETILRLVIDGSDGTGYSLRFAVCWQLPGGYYYSKQFTVLPPSYKLQHKWSFLKWGKPARKAYDWLVFRCTGWIDTRYKKRK